VKSVTTHLKAVYSRKYPYPPQGGSLEILRGRGVLNTKNFKGKYEAKLAFPEGCGGPTQKTLLGGSMDIFWNNTIKFCCLF